MKAWKVSDNNGEYGTSIVFADTSGKARSFALRHIEAFDSCEWTDLRVLRFREYDQYYDGKQGVDFWNDDDEHRIRLVRDFGWSCIDGRDSYCDACPAKQWCDCWENE